MGQCQMANKTSGWSVFDCCYMFVQRGTLRKSRKKVAQSSFFVPIVDISLIRITLRACCASTSVALLLRLFVDTVRRKNNSGTYANLVERYECLCICERQGETFCWIIPGSRRGIIRPKIIQILHYRGVTKRDLLLADSQGRPNILNKKSRHSNGDHKSCKTTSSMFSDDRIKRKINKLLPNSYE